MPEQTTAPNGVDESNRWCRYKIDANLEYPTDRSPAGNAHAGLETDWMYERARVQRIAEELRERGFGVTVRVQEYASFGGGHLDELPNHPGSANDSISEGDS